MLICIGPNATARNGVGLIKYVRSQHERLCMKMVE